MRKKKLYAAMLMLGMTNGAQALGLGELTVESSLFQPLRADIEVYGWDPQQIDNLQATLAGHNAYLRANLVRPFFLRNLKMAVVRAPDGSPVIRITSKQPVREPMLDVLVDVRWPGGRLQKQYTMLLDPPAAPARQTTAAIVDGGPVAETTAKPDPAVAGRPRPPASAEPRTENPPTPGLPAPAYPQTYAVQSRDTLSGIADRLKPAMGVTRNQLMLALLETNPNAFVAGNINGLMGGVTLQIPSPDEVTRRSPAAATALVQEQHQFWRDRNKPGLETVAVREEQTPEKNAGLRLVPTVPEPLPEVAALEAEAAEGARALTAVEAELARTRQLLLARETELDVMRSRMAVYDTELSALKKQLSDLREPAPAVAPVALDAEQPVSAAQEPVSIRTLLVALFAVLGGFGLFSILYRRLTRQREEIPEAIARAPLPLEINDAVMQPPAEVSEDTTAAASDADEEEEDADDADATPTEVREIVPVAPPGADTGDRMLVEADVLIQFGFYHRGKELMEQALNCDPGNARYRLKLMELCEAAEDPEGLWHHAELLREKITPQDAEIWASAAKMVEARFPGDQLFSAGSSMAHKIVIGEPSDSLSDDMSTGESRAVTDDDLPASGEATAEYPFDRDWSFQPPSDDADQPAPGITSEWLLPAEHLDDFIGDSDTAEWTALHRAPTVATAEEEPAMDIPGQAYRGTVDLLDRTQRWVEDDDLDADVLPSDEGTEELPALSEDTREQPVEPGAVTNELEALSEHRTEQIKTAQSAAETGTITDAWPPARTGERDTR